MTEPVDILVGLLHASGARGLPLTVARSRLEEQLKTDGCKDASERAERAIQHALDNWIVDKIIDLPEPQDGIPDQGEVWFLTSLDPQGIAKLQKLPQVEQEALKILRQRDLRVRLGAMREDDLREELRQRGFATDRSLAISDRVEDCFMIDDDGVMKPWYCLTPRYQQTEEYKAMIQELADRAIEKRTRVDEAISRSEEARERRNAARRKKRAADKKTSTEKRPSKKKSG